jgi:hypothetical protein
MASFPSLARRYRAIILLSPTLNQLVFIFRPILVRGVGWPYASTRVSPIGEKSRSWLRAATALPHPSASQLQSRYRAEFSPHVELAFQGCPGARVTPAAPVHGRRSHVQGQAPQFGVLRERSGCAGLRENAGTKRASSMLPTLVRTLPAFHPGLCNPQGTS